MKYLPRIMDSLLKEELDAFGAVLLAGPKWCGKTTTAKQIAKSMLEVKLGSRQIDEAAKNLLDLKDKVDTENMRTPSFLMIITATEYAYTRSDGVHVIPLGCLKP